MIRDVCFYGNIIRCMNTSIHSIILESIQFKNDFNCNDFIFLMGKKEIALQSFMNLAWNISYFCPSATLKEMEKDHSSAFRVRQVVLQLLKWPHCTITLTENTHKHAFIHSDGSSLGARHKEIICKPPVKDIVPQVGKKEKNNLSMDIPAWGNNVMFDPLYLIWYSSSSWTQRSFPHK